MIFGDSTKHKQNRPKYILSHCLRSRKELAVTSALINSQLEFEKPIGMGILGSEIKKEQTKSRLKPYTKSAVVAVSQMLQLL